MVSVYFAEAEVGAWRSQVEELWCRAEAEFGPDKKKNCAHYEFLGEQRNLQDKASGIRGRYLGLGEPCQIRRENLREAQSLYHWLNEADEMHAGLRERTPLAASTDYGHNLQVLPTQLNN